MSVYQINGHWHYRFTIRGTRYRSAIREARTKRQAEQAEQKARNDVFEKRWGDTGKRNFADFVENVYTPHSKDNKKGFHVERSVLRALNIAFGKLTLGEITSDRVEQFKHQRATEPTNRKTQRSKATVNRDVSVLSAIFKLALRLGEVRDNPVSNVEWYKNLPKRNRVLTDEEEVKLLTGLDGDLDLRRKVEILLYTGMRRSEMFRLEWRDIDIESGLVWLRSETTKTSKPRKIPILSNLIEIFEALRSEAGDVQPNTLVFDGTATRAGTFSLRLSEACRSLGIKGISAHVLRHTCSTNLNRFGVDAFAQKEMLGHSRLSQTADYTHQSNETFRRNFDGIEEHVRHRKLNN